jgi:pimeloyl-ACP methyl ester carboxylesterase
MHAILIHGVGRTTLSMLLLARRLRAYDMAVHLFGDSAAFEGWGAYVQRLQSFLAARTRDERFIVVGHSLGCVPTRAARWSLISPRP